MSFIAIVLVPASTHNVIRAAERSMEPYDYAFGGPPWRVYKSAQDLERLAVRYRTHAANFKKIAAKLNEEFSLGFCFDEGGVYYEAERNPNGHYESYQLYHSLLGYSWPVHDLPRDFVPGAVVTPDGEWHDWAGTNDLFPDNLTHIEQQEIQRQAYDLIEQYPDHVAVAFGYLR